MLADVSLPEVLVFGWLARGVVVCEGRPVVMRRTKNFKIFKSPERPSAERHTRLEHGPIEW